MTNKTYDILKDLATIWLPALNVCVASIWAIWGLPYGEQITATIVAVIGLLNAILGLSIKSSSKAYWAKLNGELINTDEQ